MKELENVLIGLTSSLGLPYGYFKFGLRCLVRAYDQGRVVNSDGRPLAGPRVDVRVGGWSSFAMSSGDGYFEFILSVPLVAFTAQYAYMFLVSPKEPWITPSLKEGSVFIANVFSVCAVPLLGLL